MRSFVVIVAVAVTSLPLLAPAPACAQLYGDPKVITKGDLDDQDYWWARYDDMMLDLAVKQHQPEGRIGYEIATMSRRLDDLSKKYPLHEGIKQMKQHADDVLKSLNPNADRATPFTPQCPWEESNFAQIWTNLHWAKASWAEKDYINVERLLKNINDNLAIMFAPGRMKDYPPELSKFVMDARPEADELTRMLTAPHTPAAGGAEIKPDPVVAKDPLNDQDYWWARFDDMMLDYALREHQPEGRIDFMLATATTRLDDLAAKHPGHEGIKKMQKRAADAHAKIDPNADRNLPFIPEVPWEESNFAQLWVNLHHAQTAHDQKDDATAAGLLSNVRQNQEILLRPERMKDYPSALSKWVVDSKAQADQLGKDLRGGR